MKSLYHAIEIIGTSNRARYCIKRVRENGTDPVPGPAYRTEREARAAAAAQGIQISAVGDLYAILRAYKEAGTV